MEKEPRSHKQLVQSLLELVNRQIEIHTRLKALVEHLAKPAYKSEEPVFAEEVVAETRDLFIEAEALQAEERAIVHHLFGAE